LRGLFARLPAESFSRAADIGVSPASLGAGYIVFFMYSCAIGVAALVLAVIVARRQSRIRKADPEEPTPAPA
jgi:PAT family beta-lactamase induction signal transducer AmpG